ncbi:MAG: TIGR02147 family protein [Deltaproteobacteria bacterium]|nr:TIGR02147 family protein [Deltaproteobacteria bacterium]
MQKFSAGLQLNKQEREFFRNLVWFNQAATHEEKDRYYRRLLQSRKFSQLKPLGREQYTFYSEWFHPVIRELVVTKGFDGTAEWLARQISPTIERRQTSSLVSTGPDVDSIIVMNYHRELLRLARELLPLVPAEQRDVSALTLGIPRRQLEDVKRKIREFRQELLKLAASDEAGETVVQVAIQMFPVTSMGEREMAQ